MIGQDIADVPVDIKVASNLRESRQTPAILYVATNAVMVTCRGIAERHTKTDIVGKKGFGPSDSILMS